MLREERPTSAEKRADPLAMTLREFARKSGTAIVSAGGLSRTAKGTVYRHRVDMRVPMKLLDPETARELVRMVRIRVTVEL
jgi:hypothetical protein